jgi:hypothetical protein
MWNNSSIRIEKRKKKERKKEKKKSGWMERPKQEIQKVFFELYIFWPVVRLMWPVKTKKSLRFAR